MLNDGENGMEQVLAVPATKKGHPNVSAGREKLVVLQDLHH